MAFIAPEMSLLAERVRSVGVASGASRLRSSSDLFVEFDFFIRRSLVERRVTSAPSINSTPWDQHCHVSFMLLFQLPPNDARTSRLRLLSRFAGDFLWCGSGFPMLARVFVRSAEGCPAGLRLVSLRRTEPSTAREQKHRSNGKRGKNLPVG